MPTVKIFDFQGLETGEMTLSDAVFGSFIHVPAMHQVVVAHLANCRLGTHSVKTRGDVRGGGKKPWRQKHTGRARHGSNRSPIWVGGGVAHGPHPRDYSQKVNKKVRRLAIRSALSMKVQESLFTVVKSFDIDKPSTKTMRGFFEAVKAQKPLVIVPEGNDNVRISSRNIEGAKVINLGNINVYDILNSKTLIVTPEVITKLEEVYAG
ncbi:MAG: 50S ribosomal protein L4 [Synergistaceae bacterium]|nr:50S ribosomal protein L4 [Synergistaceae bacterium]